MSPTKFSQHADHYAQHLDQAMKLDLPWAARVAYATLILTEAVDRDGAETKADLTAVLTHGLDLLIERGLAEKIDGAYSLVRGAKTEPKAGAVDTTEDAR